MVTPDGTPDSWLIFDHQATPPQGTFLRLSSKNVDFLATWEERRPDSPYKSPRGHDLILASMAIAAQDTWTDQEICDLIIAKRRERGQPLMPERDYYEGLIASAREPIERDQAEEELKILLQCPNGETTDEQRGRILDLLHSALGVRIHRIMRFIGDPPIFWMSTDGGDVTIGRVEHLTSQTDFSNLVLGATGVVIAPRKRAQWRMIVQAVVRAAIEDDVGDASYPLVQMRNWLHAYLEWHLPAPDRNHGVISGKVSFMHEGTVHIFAQGFTRWVPIWAYDMGIKPADLVRRLKLIGGTQHVMHLTVNGRPTTRSTWRLPEEFADWIRERLPKDN